MKRLAGLWTLLFLSTGLCAQYKEYTGVVFENTSRQPLANATIRLEGSGKSLITESNGDFRFNARPGQVIIISYINYKPRKVVLGKADSTLEIGLDPGNEGLSEVVITGALGIKRVAREQGVSTVVLTGKDINQTAVVNPLSGLGSKVPGLQINVFDAGVNPQVRVALRGARTTSDAKNEPLIVVDGVPLPTITYFNPQNSGMTRNASSFSLINPNDIESITVLKGANAAAIYGSQGVNGVLLVTTRQGRSGAGRISYFHTTTFDRVGWLPKLQDKYGAGFNGVYQPYESRSWGPKYDASMVKVGPLLPDGSQWILPYAPIKNQKRGFFNTGITNQENLSFSGGDKNSTYYLSAQYAHINGIIPKDRSTKTGILLNVSRRFGKLNTTYSVHYVQTNTSTTIAEPWSIVRDMPLYIPLPQLKDWKQTPFARPEYYFSSTTINPYWGIDNQRQDTKQEYITGHVSFIYPLTGWLKAIYRLGYSSAHTAMKSFGNQFDNTDVPYQYYDPNDSLQTIPRSSTSYSYTAAGGVTDFSLQNRQLNSDFILQLSRTFGDFHTQVLAGHNYQDISFDSASIGASALNLPNIFNVGNRSGNLTGGTQRLHQRRFSFYGEITIGYKDFLYGSFNGRQEAVSVLDPKNRSYFYPGGNISFIFSQAIPALKSSKGLSFGKIYTSASKTGNVTVGPYELQNTYSPVPGFPFGPLNGTAINTTNANRDLRPEFVYSYEGGIQMGFFKDRISLEATYASIDSRDQILDVLTSYATGFGSAKYNSARMKSKSLELSVSGRFINTKDWEWSLNAGYTHNTNKGIKLFGEDQLLLLFKGLYLAVGKPYPAYYYPVYEKDPAGHVIVNSITGYPVQAPEQSYVGSSQPIHMLGAGTSVRFKRFSFAARVDARWGQNFYTAAAENETTTGLAPVTVLYNREPFLFPNSVIQTSPGVFESNKSIYAAGDYNFWNTYKSVNSNNVVDGKYVKLREVSLSYHVPVALPGKEKAIKDIRVTLIARNLISIRARDNVFGDPESIYLNTVGFLGFRTIPSARTYGFSLNLIF